jgi:hypothetical protein
MPKSNKTPYTTSPAGGKMSTKVHQSLLAGAMCLALLIAPACSSGGSDQPDDPPDTRASTTTVQPTTTTTTTEDAVREAYDAFVEMLERISTTTVDPNDPELPMRLTDPALGGFRTQLSTWQAEGQVWLTGDETRHHIESVAVNRDGVTAVVTDCVVANDALVPRGTTSVTFPAPRTDRGVTTMVNENGHWLVKDTDSGGHWEGVAGCAA